MLREQFGASSAVAFNVTGSRTRIGRDLERLARDAGFTYVDIGTRFTDGAKQGSVFLQDGVHWNEAGHALAGGILVDEIARAIR
jgi:hypothetical protein